MQHRPFTDTLQWEGLMMYRSKFAEDMENMLRTLHNSGLKVTYINSFLNSFDTYCSEKYCDDDILSMEIAEGWMAYYSQITGAFTFPFPTDGNPEPFILGKYNTQNMMTIVNDGDEIGFTLVIEALEDARSPTLYNADTDEYLQITGDILAGDIITVTTKTGNKTVTLDRGGVKTNIINRLVSGSTWLTLREGKNRFYLRGTGLTKLRVKIIHTNAYLGV